MHFTKRLRDRIRSGEIADVDDLLAIAKHGRGESIYLVHFRYVPPRRRLARSAPR